MIYNLHLLRGIAALMVVMHHALYVLERNGLIGEYPGFGALGVDLFFVISGFVIVISTKPDRSPFDFLRRRFLRVVPLYWVVTVAVCGLYLVDTSLESDNLPTISEFIKSLLFIPYVPAGERPMPILLVGWTLYYEIFFYLIFFVCLTVLRFERVIVGAAVVIALLAALSRFVPSDFVSLTFYSNPIILEFLWGMVLAVLWRDHRTWFSNLNPAALGIALVAGLALMVVSNGAHNPFIAGIGAALIIAGALGWEHRGQYVTSSAASFFGDISYSLYLIHFSYFIIAEAILIRMGLIESMPAVIIGMLLAFVSVCFLASMSFRLIETPLAKLARSSARGKSATVK